jgi:ferredoxin-NADP reductase
VNRALPPKLPRTDPGADAELNQILAFARDRAAAQRARLVAAGLAPGVASPFAPREARPPTGEVRAPARAGGAAPGTLLERVDVSPSIALFRLARPPALRFEAGQAVKVSLGGVRRSYTIASAPEAPHVELCVERVPGGALTSRLFGLAPGERVDLGARAKGDLVLDPSASAHLMVATVTGVAPFMSMLRHVLPRAPQTRVLLLHGARLEEDLVYRSELDALAARSPGLAVRRALTQPRPGWAGLAGRVTAHVDDALAALGAAGPIAAYACGHPDMVREVTAHLGALGVPVRTEEFFS